MAPDTPNEKVQALIADIVSLDHASVHTLRPGSVGREEVKWLLWNAVSLLRARQEHGSRILVDKAVVAYGHHIQTRNRISYLIGTVLGVVTLMGIAGVITRVTFVGEASVFDPGMLLLIILFAGMGSVTSVLTRLHAIDLRQETSRSLLLVSGATRPIVACFFSLVAYLVIHAELLAIQIGTGPAKDKTAMYLIVAFLCGFSERFATDLISRVGLGNLDEAVATVRPMPSPQVTGHDTNSISAPTT